MKTDLLLFLGQSNMQGETECLSESETVDGAWEYRYLTDRLVPLCNPVGEDIRTDMTEGYPSAGPADDHTYLSRWLKAHVFGASDAGHTNMVPSFARAYIAETGHPVAAVHAAKGSTVIADWLPGTIGFRGIVEKANGAIRAIGKENLGHLYAVWLQGESDALAKTDEGTYRRSLIELKNGLCEALPLETFGIILVGHFAVLANWDIGMTQDEALTCDETIRAAQKSVCDTEPGFLMLSTITNDLLYGDKAYLNPHVAGHYGALGLEALGNDAGHALGRYASHRPTV